LRAWAGADIFESMTHHNPSTTVRPPGRRWYVVAAVAAVVGWTAMGVFMVSRLGGSAGRMMRVVVPGQADLSLKEPGTYTIFHEYQSTFEGRAYSVDAVSGLKITVRARPSGQVLPLQNAVGSSYSVGAQAGRSLFDFVVPAAGTYEISAAYDGGRQQPQTVLAIDRGFIGDLILTILGALAMAFAGMGTAIAIAVVVFTKRRRAKRAAAA
jgi:hypothetical protein